MARAAGPGHLVIEHGAALLLLLALSASAAAASITSQVALPVPEGEWIVRGLGVYRQAASDPSPQDRELTVVGTLGVVGYGVSGEVDLFAAVPYLRKKMDASTPGGRIERGDTGIGDLRLWSRIMFWSDDRKAEARRVAGIIGLETPTGDHDEHDAHGRLPRPLQLGSGSWDPFAGIIFTWQRLDWELDVASSYQHNTRHETFRFGEELSLDVSWYYRLLPRRIEGGVPGFLYGGLESNLLWQDRNEIAGDADADSGGTSWFLSPGLQYVTQRWIAEGVVQLPVIQDLNGSALETDVSVMAGMRFNF